MTRMHSRTISVIGLGYVGLPVAVAFGKQRQSIGFDINSRRIAELQRGLDRSLEVTGAELAASDIFYTSDPADLARADFHIVGVPTPINDSKQPDLTPLIRASETLGPHLKPGDIVVYESTVYPGTTEEDCVPILEQTSGLVCGRDFFVGYSPERINPGDQERTFTNILKIVSGQTPEVLEIIAAVYESVVKPGVHRAASIKVAEAAKVIENTQRDLNIALMNELSLIFDVMNIDTNEVIDAAATKWNFVKFTPGLVGGHCIGVDPYYLTFKAEELGYKPDLILAARQINNIMAAHIVEKTIKEMILSGCTIFGSDVLIMGVAFKENCPDMRNTKVIDIIEGLKEFGVNVDVYDPWIDLDKESAWYQHGSIADPFSASKKYDAVIVAVAHSQFRDIQKSTFQGLAKKDLVLMDVKGIYPESTWRL